MEMKSTKPMKLTAEWLKQNILAYKRWFVFTGVVLSVITIIIPMLFEQDPIYFLIPGMIALFLISFVMMLSQLNFLHDSKAFAYVSSKALPLKSRLWGIVITQALFCAVFLIYLYVIGYVSIDVISNHGRFDIMELNMYFTTVTAWVLILLLLVPISALLSGTSISAAVSTLFNFSIPLSILGVIYFIINVANSGTVGLNVNDIMAEVILRYYRLDYMYHVDSPWYVMIFILALTLGGLYGVLNWLIKNRKHERIGQSYVFKGYKVFILFLLSLLAPLGLTLFLVEASFASKWIAVLILGSITLYILLAILDKNLKLSKKAYSLIGFYLMAVTLCIGIATWGLNFYVRQIPNLDEVEAVLLSNNTSIRESKGKYISIYALAPSSESADLPIYRSDSGRKQVRLLHQMIIEEPKALSFSAGENSYWYYSNGKMNFNMVYFMKDGSRKIFPFSIPYSLTEEDKGESAYDVWAEEMLKEEVFMASVSPILYGSEVQRTRSADLYLPDGTVTIDQQQLSKLMDFVRNDLKIKSNRSWFWYLYSSNDEFRNPFYNEEGAVYKYNISLETNNGYYFNYTVYEHQKDLINYLEDLKKK